MPDEMSTSGEVLLGYVKAELDAEAGRQESLEKRGLALVTVSGALVTLLLGLPTAVGRPKLAEMPAGSTPSFLIALAAFALTAICAAGTNAPRRVRLIDSHALLARAAKLWDKPADEAERATFATRIEQLHAIQKANDRRGVLVLSGVISLTVAVLSLAFTVAATVLSS